MNKATRMFSVTGLALVAGLSMGVAPASAAPSAAAAPAAAVASAHGADKKAKRERVVGFYRNPRDCVRAGRIGEIRNRWDDFDCERVRFGFRRGWYALEVSWDNRGHGGHHGGGHHGGGHWGGNGPRR